MAAPSGAERDALPLLRRPAPGEPGPGAGALEVELAPNEAINIQFTSGTTGRPKGATLTHRNIVNNARFATGTIEATHEDRICIPVPFYHCFGMVVGTLG